MTPTPGTDLAAALPDVVREVEDFVSSGGWDQPPQLFALVETVELMAAEPGVSGSVDPAAPITPVAQEPLPDEQLDVALAGITWPPAVAGCAVAVQIVVLPPAAEAELTATLDPASGPAGPSDPAVRSGAPGSADSAAQSELLHRLAAEHPRRREARLVAAALRDGTGACVLRLRGDEDEVDELVEHPDLAPNLLEALRATFRP